MRDLRHTFAAAAAFLLLAGAACGNEPPRPEAAPEAVETEQGGVLEEAGQAPAEIPIADLVFDPGRFSDPTTVDNRWFPLRPGIQYVYEGSALDEDERISRRVVFTVTDLTKVVDGVRTVVGWDRDHTGGSLEEAEIIFLAQDDDGNVWHFGQLNELYDEEGEFLGHKAWLAGRDGAKAGIMMAADPQPGEPALSQGFAPAPHFWDDHSWVHQTGQKTCVPAGCYQDVLVMDEFEPSKPGAHQLKYYAPGVGSVRVGFMGNDPEGEVLELVKVVELDDEELAEARAAALQIDARALAYSRGAPVEGPAGG